MLTCRNQPRPHPIRWQTFSRTVPVWMAWIFRVVLAPFSSAYTSILSRIPPLTKRKGST